MTMSEHLPKHLDPQRIESHLNRCPFCDSEPNVYRFGEGWQVWCASICAVCVETRMLPTIGDAVKAWNHRVSNTKHEGELGLCPFCGSEPVLCVENHSGEDLYLYECTNEECEVLVETILTDNRNTAQEWWNTRHKSLEENDV